MNMVVYPEVNSWDEFYPSEIFVQQNDTESDEELFPIFKKAKIGSTFYVGVMANGAPAGTTIYKKIGDIEAPSDVSLNFLIVGNIAL